LPRQPGTKESRYMHMWSGDVAPFASDEPEAAEPSKGTVSGQTERIMQLEAEVLELRRELETLREQFAAFQKQFQ
jgi:uncharacterized protein